MNKNRYKDKKDKIEFCISSVIVKHHDDGSVTRTHIDREYVDNFDEMDEIDDIIDFLIARLHIKFSNLPK